VNISFLDDAKRVVFVNRHLCTHIDKEGQATYAPPHEACPKAWLEAFVVDEAANQNSRLCFCAVRSLPIRITLY